MSDNKALLLKTLMVCVLLAGVGVAVNGAAAQGCMTDKQTRMKQVSEAADHLIERFRETLDIGVVFDETASWRAQQLLQSGRFSMHRVDRHLLQALDTQKKERLFKAEMNFNYIGFAYTLTFIENLGDEGKERISFPKEIKDFAAKSKFMQKALGNSSSSDMLPIVTDEDLSLYLTEIEQLTALLKTHLPKDYFKSTTYKKNYERFVQSQDKFLRPRMEILRGHPDLGVSKDTEAFLVIRDLFTIYFVEENGQMKLLAFGIGN